MEPKAYIAAYFKELPSEFTLGDAKMYGDFENKPLQSGQEYIFFVLAVLEMSDHVSDIVFRSCADSGFFDRVRWDIQMQTKPRWRKRSAHAVLTA